MVLAKGTAGVGVLNVRLWRRNRVPTASFTSFGGDSPVSVDEKDTLSGKGEPFAAVRHTLSSLITAGLVQATQCLFVHTNFLWSGLVFGRGCSSRVWIGDDVQA